jgi:hypothetical protein
MSVKGGLSGRKSVGKRRGKEEGTGGWRRLKYGTHTFMRRA